MFQIKQGESTASRKRLPILLVDITDGYTAETGVTSPTISISKNGATAAAGSGSFVEIGLGQYYYEFASGEIDTLGWVAVNIVKTGTTRDYNAIVQIMAYDYAAASNLGLSSLPTAAIGATGALLTSYTSNGALDVTATGAVNNVDTVVSGVTLAAGTGSSVAQDVWNYDISGIGSTNLAGGALEAAAGGTAGAGCSSALEIAQEVWNFDISAYASGTGLAGDQLNNAEKYIWEVDMSTLSIGDFWQAGNKLSEIYNSVYDANIPGPIIASSVWNYDTSGMTPGSLAGGYLNDISTWSFSSYNETMAIPALPQNVWEYNISGLAGLPGIAGSELLAAAVGSSSSQEIANTVWGTDISAYTSPSAGYDLANAGAGASATLTTGDVEGLRYRLGLDGTATAPTANGNLGNNVGTISYVGTVSGNVNGNIIGDINGDLTGSVNNVNNFAQGAIQSVWQYEETGIGLTTSIGYRLKTNIDAQVSQVDNNVWSYNTGTGASAAAQLNLAAQPGTGASSATAQQIAQAVWEANVVGVGGTTSAAVYLTETLYTAGNIEVYVANQTPQDVWTYAGLEGRTITGGTGVTLATALPSNFSLLDIDSNGYVTYNNAATGASSPLEIAQAVWGYSSGRTITGGTITTNNDKTGYSLTQSFPANFADLAITATTGLVTTSNPGTGSTVSPQEVAQAVWGYTPSRTITGGTGVTLATALPSNFSILSINGSGQVTTSNPGTGSTATPAQVAAAVWGYNTGTGASAAAQINSAAIGDSAASAKAVWDTNLLPYYVAGPSDIAGRVVYETMAQTDQIPLNVWQHDPGPYKTTGYNYFGGLVWAAATGASAAQNVWTYNTGTGASAAAQLNAAAIAGSGGSSASEVAQAVWSYNTGTGASAAGQLNSAAIAGSGGSSAVQVAQEVWDYLLGPSYVAGYWLSNIIPSGIDNITNQTLGISTQVWSQELTDIGGGPIFAPTQAGRYLYNTAAGISSTSALSIAQSVWNYNTGTGASASTQLNTAAASGSSSLIASAVWSAATRTITGGTITTNSDKTGYSLTQAFPTNFSTLSINGSGQVTTSNPGTGASSVEIANAVWSAANRTITGGTGVTLATALPTNFSLLSINGSGLVTSTNAGSGGSSATEVAQAVWAAGTRTITGGTITTNSDKTGYSLTQTFPTNFSTLSINGSGQVTTSNPGTGSSSSTEIASAVWSAATRTITGGTGVTLATALPNNISILNIDGSGKVSVQSGDITTIKSGLSTLTQAQVGTEVDSSLSDVGLTSTVTGRIDAAISSRLSSANTPPNFDIMLINGSGEVTTSNPGTGTSVAQIVNAVWTANQASIGASAGQFGYYLNAPVSAAGGTVTQVMLGPFALSATDGNNAYLNVFVDDERPVELVIADQNGNAIPLDSNNTHSVLVYDSGSTLVATYTGTVEYEAGGLVSFNLDADVTGTAGSYKVVIDVDNGLTVSKYGGLTILVRLC
jgi:hypothetical protein